MTPFSNVLHPGNSSSRGQNTGEFKQHIFEESPQGIRIIDSNLKPSFKRVLGLRATLWWGGSFVLLRTSCGPTARAVHSVTELHVSPRFNPILHGSLHRIWIIPPCPLDVW